MALRKPNANAAREDKGMRESKALPNKEKPVRGVLLSISQASERTHLSKAWIYQHMDNGTLPFPWFLLTVGKRAIDSADIDDWLWLKKIPAAKKKPEDI
jgi:predicted DNA-binding transcriptional regulator AlpA